MIKPIEERATTYVPARDLTEGDVMWDPSGPYRVSNVRKDRVKVTFDVVGYEHDFGAAGWVLDLTETIRIYV